MDTAKRFFFSFFYFFFKIVKMMHKLDLRTVLSKYFENVCSNQDIHVLRDKQHVQK